jgi:succinoglycan biosynthesis transport protein ExoP
MSLTQAVPSDPMKPSDNESVSAPAPPAALATAPDALALWKCLRRCWGWAVAVGILAAGVSAVFAWNVIPPSKHTARTLIRVPQRKPFVWPSVENTPAQPDYQRTQVALVKSRLVLNAALKRPGIGELESIRSRPNVLEWLERTVQVDFTVAPEVIRISLSGDNADDLAKLVSALRDAYRGEILDKDRAERIQRLKTLGKQRQAYAEQLQAKLETARQMEQQGAAKDTPTRMWLQSFDQMQLGWYQKDLIQAESDLNRAKTELAIRQEDEKRSAKAVVPDVEIQTSVNRDPLVLKGQEQVESAKENFSKVVRTLAKGEADPLLQPHRKRLADAEQTLEKLKMELRPKIAEAWRATQRAAAAEAVRQVESRVAFLTAQSKSLREQVDGLHKAIQKRNENNVQIDNDRDATTRLEGIVKQLGDEEARLQFDLETNPVRFEVIEDATVLGAADDKRRLLGTAGAFAGTFALLLMAFAYREFQARKIGTVEEIVHGLGLKLVGTIPISTQRRTAIRATMSGDVPLHSTLAEAIHGTRVMLLRAARSESLRIVMVTSASSGEGKTSLSAQLAASLAQTNLRTLLIDGDLRNPTLHQVFGADMTPGFCELLRGEAATAAVIRATSVDSLSLIAAGRWSSQASQALAQEGVAGRYLRQFREEFDFVIIDSSPVLPVVDPLLIGQLADGTILSVLRDVSRMPNVYAAYQRLTAGGVRVLGAVVNGVRSEAYGTAYPYRARVEA